MRPLRLLARILWVYGDGAIIDGLGPDGVSARVVGLAKRAVRFQTGYVYQYAFVMLIGVVALVTYFAYLFHGATVQAMKDWPILTTIILLPLLGSLLLVFLRGNDEAAKRNARWIALWTTLITFGVSLVLVAKFDPASRGFQFVEHKPWLSDTISYYLGVDGLSLPFVILTTFLMPICILASWTSIQTRVKEYMIAFLLLETLMIGVFWRSTSCCSTCSSRAA